MGDASRENMRFFVCEKGHHCEVFVSKMLMESLGNMADAGKEK